jgi:hypothetical protein
VHAEKPFSPKAVRPKKVIFERKTKMTKESEIISYQGDDGNVKIEVFYHDETFWMTKKRTELKTK